MTKADTTVVSIPNIFKYLEICHTLICAAASVLTIVQLVVEVGSIGMLAHLGTIAYFRWQTSSLQVGGVADLCRYVQVHLHVDGHWSAHVLHADLHLSRMVVSTFVALTNLLHADHRVAELTVVCPAGSLGGWVADRWNAPPPPTWLHHKTDLAKGLLLCLLLIWTNTFYNLDKYILKYGQIHFAIWTNTFDNLDKYILQFG